MVIFTVLSRFEFFFLNTLQNFALHRYIKCLLVLTMKKSRKQYFSKTNKCVKSCIVTQGYLRSIHLYRFPFIKLRSNVFQKCINSNKIALMISISTLQDRVHCFSMQVVRNKCFLLNPETKFCANLPCRFREKRSFNSQKWRHRAEG